MTREQIESLLKKLNEELRRRDIKGELSLYGGAVMCLAYAARPSTKDIDAIFHPTKEIRDAAAKIAAAEGLPVDWLNDAVKGFVVDHGRTVWLELSNLRALVPAPDYLLAMKALAARVDATDQQDVRFLAKHLGIKSAEEVFAILEKYYPQEQIKPATRFFIEEMFQ